MSDRIGELTLEEAAHEAAGNWTRWNSFAWFRDEEITEAENWFIYYGHHRDSGLLDLSNSAQIGVALKPFIDADSDDPDVVEEDHSHFLVGWIRGWSVRVYRNDEITEAFKVLHRLLERLAAYPILCESHYGELELEATWENIPVAAAGIVDEYDVPDDWPKHVHEWLSSNLPNSLENTADQGGWPSECDFRAAFEALGYEEIDAVV